MNPGDMVLVKTNSICNPFWGSPIGVVWTSSDELGIIVEEKRDWCKVKTNTKFGWISKENLTVLNTF